MARRGSAVVAVWLMLLVGEPCAAAAGPAAEDARLPVARRALDQARSMVQLNRKLPQETVYEIGLLQALLGDLEGGLATIKLTEDPTGVGGPRWRAMWAVGRELTPTLGTEVVGLAGQRQRGNDRAAVLFGVAEAQLTAGDETGGLITISGAAVDHPAVGAELLLDLAEAADAPSANLIGRATDLAKQIPPTERDGAGRSRQAVTLGRLVGLHAAAGNDAAALAAADAVTDPTDRAAPLLTLLTLQADAGRFAAAVDTAAKLSGEQIEPATAASWQVVGLAAVAARQAKADATGAKSTAQRAADVARRVVDPFTRVASMVQAAEALVVAGDPQAGSALAGEALAALATGTRGQRAAVLLNAGRVHALADNRELAEVYFKSGREVAGLAKDAASLAAAVAVPAGVGYVPEANAGLELVADDPPARRANRVLLARSLAAAGFRGDAVAAARAMPRDVVEDKHALIEALCAVVEASAGDSNAELLREAIDVAADPFDLPGLERIAETAVLAGLPTVTVDTYAAVLAGGARLGRAESALKLPVFLARIRQAIAGQAASGGSMTALVGAAEQAALTTRDATGRAAALADLGLALADAGEVTGAERLLTAGTAAIQQVAPDEARVAALAEMGAVAHDAGLAALSEINFTGAEAVMASLPRIPAATLLTLAECQVQAQRAVASRFLFGVAMGIPDFEKDGSTDLLAIARIALCGGMLGDSEAAAKRIYRPEEQLVALLDLARALADRPLTPLRPASPFPRYQEVWLAKG